jgi:hypothetical protein
MFLPPTTRPGPMITGLVLILVVHRHWLGALASGTGQLSQPHRDLFGQHQLDVGGRVECVSFGM